MDREEDRPESDGPMPPDAPTRDFSSQGEGAPGPRATAPEIRFEPSRRSDSLGRLANYEILEYLGRGGMGMVWKAFDETLRRPVALKLMLPELAWEEAARQRFLREARSAAAVRHPNVVTIYAVGEYRRTPYLAMEFVEGGTLRDRLDEDAELSLRDALDTAIQVARGLKAVHESEIIHRDLKPSNVLLERDGSTCKIGDFGLARVGEEKSDLSATGATFGTTAYMSPEQLQGEPLDVRSDLFSLGSLLYELIAGEAPFRGPTTIATAQKVVFSLHRPLHEVREEVPIELSRFVDKLLAKSPADRPASAEEVISSLVELRSTLQTDAPSVERRPSAPSSAIARWKSTARAGLVLSVVVALLCLAIGGAFVCNPASQPGEGQDASIVEVTVSLSGDADFSSIEQAMAEVSPGGIVRVIGEGAYPTSLILDDPSKWNGVRIIADEDKAVILRQFTPDRPVIDLQGLEGVKIEGFRIEVDGDSHAIRMKNCQNVTLRDLDILQTATRNKAAIQVVDCNAASDAAPLQIIDCTVRTETTGQCLWIQSDAGPIWNVVLKGNAFVGNGGGTLVAIVAAPGGVEARNNRFENAHVGLNLDLRPAEQPTSPDQMTVADNVFVSCNAWTGLVHSDPARTPFSLVRNFVRDSRTVEATTQQLDSAAEHCQFTENRWIRRSTDPPLSDSLRKWADVEVDDSPAPSTE